MAKYFQPLQTGKIEDGLFAVKTGPVDFYVYQKDGTILCFDAGYGLRLAAKGLDAIGIDPAKVTHLFLTHTDPDHRGGIKLFPNAQVLLSSDEEPLITRKQVRHLGFVHNRRIKSPYKLLSDGEEINVGTVKIKAIAAPGHTIGSMCYLVDGSILFSGDAFSLLEGKAFPARNFINMDTALARESLKKLARLSGVRLACTAHTGLTRAFDDAFKDWK